MSFGRGVLGEYTAEEGGGIFNVSSSRARWAQSVAVGNAAYPDGDWAVR